MKSLSFFYKIFISGLVLIMAINVFLDYRESAIISDFLKPNEDQKNILINFERAQRNLTLQILKSNDSAEAFVLGSSHCYLFDKSWFDVPFINLSVTSGSIFDFAVFTENIIKRGKAPALVIIGIDYWVVAERMFAIETYNFEYLINYLKFSSEATKNYFKFLSLFKHFSINLQVIFNYDLLKSRLLYPPFISSAEYFKNCIKSDIGYGIDRQIYKNASVYLATDDSRNREALSHFSTVKKEFSLKPQIDNESLIILNRIIERIKSSGAEVVLFAPPFSFNEFELYKSDIYIFERVTFFYSEIKKVCEKNGIHFLNISDPNAKNLNLQNNDFFDGHHTTPEGTFKILKYIYTNVPLKKNVINVKKIFEPTFPR